MNIHYSLKISHPPLIDHTPPSSGRFLRISQRYIYHLMLHFILFLFPIRYAQRNTSSTKTHEPAFLSTRAFHDNVIKVINWFHVQSTIPPCKYKSEWRTNEWSTGRRKPVDHSIAWILHHEGGGRGIRYQGWIRCRAETWVFWGWLFSWEVGLLVKGFVVFWVFSYGGWSAGFVSYGVQT